MKFVRFTYILLLSLLLLAGTIQCSGPRSQIVRETVPEETPPAEPSKELSAIPSEPAKESPPTEPPQAPLAPQKGESLAERLNRVPEPPRPVPPQGRPSLPAPAASPNAPAPPPVPGAPPPPAPGQAQKGSRFVLNFDNADIYEVIRVMAEMMNVNYIVDPRVKGVVNIRTTGQISTQDIFPIFQAILNMNGATAVKKGIIYEIVPFGEAKKLHTTPSTSRDVGKDPAEERYTIQILALKYIPAGEVSKMIKPFLSDGADIVEHPFHNIVIVGDLSSNVSKVMDIIQLFDVDVFADMRVRIYPVLNADVTDVAKEMERIFSSLEVSVKSGRGVGITFTPVTRINSLLVVSSIPGVFDKVERWLKELDRVPGEGTQVSVFVYYVQNGKAKDLAEVLKQVYVPLKGAKAETARSVTPSPTPPGQRSIRPSTPGTPAPSASREEGGGVPEGEINIVVDETTNSLIIRAYQRDYKAIIETVRKLDIYPKQVLIEVLLAEVTLDDTTKYGLEFSTFTDSFSKGGRTYNYTLGIGGIAPQTSFVSGLRYAITSVDRLAAAVNLSAVEDRLRVISSPHILASNNKEARIQIGQSQPILTNTYTTTGTSSPGVVEGTIEYKDIGIILIVTPRISDGKLVTLDISVEQSTVGKTALGSLSDVPFFPKKTAKTTLSIGEGQTIVIGGLIEDRKENVNSGVPWLSKIPVFGALFGYQSRTVNKTETVLFLTPRVIGDMGDSNRVTEEFREKVYGIQRELEKQKSDLERRKKLEGYKKPSSPAVPSAPGP
jgi:general secretion pathway protein D